MEILVIEPQDIEPLNVQVLSSIATKEEVHFVNGGEHAIKFIETNLIECKKHIDLILWRVNASKRTRNDNIYEKALTFSKWLRNTNNTYSNGNFLIKSLPMVFDISGFLIHPFSEREKKLLERSFDLVVNLNDVHLHVNPTDLLGIPLNNWLNFLASDLDNLNLDLNFDFSRSLVLTKDTFDTKVISPHFINKRQKLNYIWVGDNYKKLDVNLSELNVMLKKSNKNRKLRNEKEYHAYLLRNEGLFLRDHYSRVEYEKQFYFQDSRKYVEQDFTAISHTYSFKPINVIEVKLPNQTLVGKRTGRPTRYLRNSIEQIGSKYFDYFSNFSQNEEEIKKRLGINEAPTEFKYTLLIGRDEDKQENEYQINKQIEKVQANVNLISFDELMTNYQKVFNRIKQFRLH